MNENLKPFRKGEERARDAGRKGGIASGISRRESLRELLLAELDQEHTGLFGSCGYSHRAAIAKALVEKAAGGDMRAVNLILQIEGDAQSVGEA